ncbi:testis-expressed protein 19.2-like [Acomys russatus]|uniref:testis-expressed protein 19.2-like n=1 Tax=Acomys russatus TaxID=60746 RepID=UPI0021E2CA6D|nr:testis-expressed protein 19.2-like [Acomys russatus]
MCPPVSVRHGDKGMSCLYAAWLYQLVHGDQMKICFACFKATFLMCKENLEEAPEESLAEPELMAGSGSGSGSGLGSGSTYGYLLSTDSKDGEPELLKPLLQWIQEMEVPKLFPTELGPEEVVPLDLGPEDAEWTQALPWLCEELYPCLHQLMPPMSLWDIVDFNPALRQPVLLEVSTIWPVNCYDAGSFLLSLQFFVPLMIHQYICHLLSMHVCWVVRIHTQRWQVLLDPGEVMATYLPHTLSILLNPHWRLSILESSQCVSELVPATCSLRKKGFRLHSYLPWHDHIPDDWSRPTEDRVFVTKPVPVNHLFY